MLPTSDVGGVDTAVYRVLWYLVLQTAVDRCTQFALHPVIGRGVTAVCWFRVIGLYVSLVLVVGRFVRMWLQGLSFRIMFVELPVPDFLLKLCLDIYMVRECLELRVEEELFSQLLFLYRSPETLIKVTKQKLE